MSAVEARSALAAGVGSTKAPSKPQIDAQRCGTRSGYAAGCRCRPCRDATAEYSRRRYREVAYGRWVPKGPHEPYKELVEGWRRQGHTLRDIAAASGLAEKVLDDLLNGRRKMLQGPTRAALDAAGARLGPSRFVDATGPMRRLQALARVGWTLVAVSAAACGTDAGLLGQVMAGHRIRIWRTTAEAIAAAYDELWDATPPQGAAYDKARERAIAGNWALPMAWDDETIDDPTAQPQGLRDDVDTTRVANDPALVDEVRVLAAGGLTDRQIGYRVGLGESGVQKLRTRYGIRRAA